MSSTFKRILAGLALAMFFIGTLAVAVGTGPAMGEPSSSASASVSASASASASKSASTSPSASKSASGVVTASPTASSVFYATCAQAPYRLIKGIDPGYRPDLDSDGDGTACESRGPKPAQTDGATLPLTGERGNRTPLYVGLAVSLLVVGSALIAWALVRRPRFRA